MAAPDDHLIIPIRHGPDNSGRSGTLGEPYRGSRALLFGLPHPDVQLGWWVRVEHHRPAVVGLLENLRCGQYAHTRTDTRPAVHRDPHPAHHVTGRLCTP